MWFARLVFGSKQSPCMLKISNRLTRMWTTTILWIRNHIKKGSQHLKLFQKKAVTCVQPLYHISYTLIDTDTSFFSLLHCNSPYVFCFLLPLHQKKMWFYFLISRTQLHVVLFLSLWLTSPHIHSSLYAQRLAGRPVPLPCFHPLADSIVCQCSRCANDGPLFGWHSALFPHISISIAGCVIAQPSTKCCSSSPRRSWFEVLLYRLREKNSGEILKCRSIHCHRSIF